MAVGIARLVTPLVKSEVLADIYTLLGLFGLTTTALQPGEPIPVVLDSVVSWAVDKIWNPIVVPALQAPFLDYATDDWLTLVAALVYNRPRIPAQSGTAPLDVENRSAVSGVVTINPGTLRFRNATTGKTYTNSTTATVAQWTGAGPYPVATPTMTFEADEVGTGSNADTDAIKPFPVVPVTSPSVGLYYVNVSPIVASPPILGSDEETDANLVTRCRAAVGELTPGSPGLAYLSVALDPVGAFTRRNQVPPVSWGIAPPAITRVRVIEPEGCAPWAAFTFYFVNDLVTNDSGKQYVCITQGNAAASGGPTGTGQNITDGTAHWQFIGRVSVWLASASGPAAGDNATPDSDVFKANTAIQLFTVPPGIFCTVAPAKLQNLALGTITLDVAAESNVTIADAIATATLALDTFFSTLPIGGARNVASPQGYVFFAKVMAVLCAGAGVETAVCSTFTVDQAVFRNSVVVPSYIFAVNIVTQGAF